MGQCFFSVLMCVYNKTELLEYAIGSVREQTERSWELLIMDNSDGNRENTWRILSEISQKDARIRIFRSSENVGWARGASQLLRQASGKYMTFLAADDFLLPGALTKVRQEAEEHEPDVLWVGNKYFEHRADSLWELGETAADEKRVLNERRAENIKLVMEHVFYNAFFHYVKVEFLREQNIDFYSCGYGDCAGMTRVLSQAGRMVILSEAVYGLTVNTSQSRGTFYWDGEQYIFSDQWESVKRAYMRDARFSFHELKYCAMVILKNEIGNMMSLAEGCKCVNQEMNPVPKDFRQRLLKVKQILENPAIWEMAQFYGRYEYEQEIMTIIERLLADYQEDGGVRIEAGAGWMGELLRAVYYKQSDKIVKREVLKTEEAEGLAAALADLQNTGMFGMGLFWQAASGLRDEGGEERNESLIEKVRQLYLEWKGTFVEQIWNGLGNGGNLSGNGRIELAAFCKYIMEN